MAIFFFFFINCWWQGKKKGIESPFLLFSNRHLPIVGGATDPQCVKFICHVGAEMVKQTCVCVCVCVLGTECRGRASFKVLYHWSISIYCY